MHKAGEVALTGTPALNNTPMPQPQGAGYLLRRGATVFNSTARQLGLIRTSGVPSLQVGVRFGLVWCGVVWFVVAWVHSSIF